MAHLAVYIKLKLAMLNSIRNLLWHLKSPAAKRREEEEAMEQGFHDIPHPKERASMSPEKLAIVLSGCAKDSPQYILVSHELNVRIAKVQSRDQYGAALFGLGGVVLGAFLAAFLQQLQPEVRGKGEGNQTDAKVEVPAKAVLQADGKPKK